MVYCSIIHPSVSQQTRLLTILSLRAQVEILEEAKTEEAKVFV